MTPPFNSIGTPFLGGGVPRLYGVDMPRVTTVSPDVQVVTSPFERPEQWALLGGGLWSATMTVVAATLPYVGVYNPAGSGVLSLVERLTISTQAAAASRMHVLLFKGILAGASSTTQNRDLRRVTGVQATGSLATQQQVDDRGAGDPAGSAVIWRQNFAAGQAITLDPFTIVLPPGWGCWAMDEIGATTMYGTFWGRERPVSPSELTL